jgi:Mechanosensitive ion channel
VSEQPPVPPRATRVSRNLAPIGLVSLQLLAILALVFTNSASREPSEDLQHVQRSLVDQQPLETARVLQGLAVTPEEQQLARNAVRIADQAVDLAFDMALRTASQQSAAPETAETLRMRKRIQDANVQVTIVQERLKQLTAQTGNGRDGFEQQVEVARAQATLNQDELDAATEDLTRAGGDRGSMLQRLLAEHDAAEHQGGTLRDAAGASSATGSAGAIGPIVSPWSLVAKWRRWNALRVEHSQFRQAEQDAAGAATPLARTHDELQAHVRQDQSQGAVPGQAAGLTLGTLRRRSVDEKNLTDLGKRVQDFHELAAIYGQWDWLVRVRQLASLHDVIWSVLLIVSAVLIAFLANRWFDHVFAQIALDRKQQLAVRSVVRFAVRALALVAILLAIFGSPYQVSTIVGLVGAGLTVTLKDVILSFLGWFMLMGRSGIRVGDWVEINGVRGEVAEIGLWRTVLLENTPEGGRPTGRQAAFLNSFALEGHYFNFSTSGQWLWDELIVFVPPQLDPYALVDQIQAILAKETAGNAAQAEQDWNRATRRFGVTPLSAAPEVSMGATDHGVQVIVRYVTQAPERAHVRARLNHAMVELLHERTAAAAAITDAAPLEDRPREASAV